ncbi:hypothetical protein EDB81DRAFT_656908 [Dactylonectria macrodidyma]|uniref:Uncharacterized protein n=1 Tax=Dactylonectria macrodidyma TaxID=307937 RepID=A0A9P9EDF5_9HYPO|nr:hypothetical protein EDB81DRAFT_656908 [Dactylonectria macrodidyma]
MSTPELNDVLRIPAYNQDSEDASQEISWTQMLKSKTATYYIVSAKNTSKHNADALIFIQERIYKDDNSADFIGKLPGAKKDGADWVVTITDRFQYGQKNASGEKRWIVLHDKSNKIFQHRFLVTTTQGNAVDWAKKLADSFGASELAENVSGIGGSFVGDYLKTF